MQQPSLLVNRHRDIETEYRPDAEIVLKHGDVNSFIATLPDGLVKLVVTSPPYNIGKEYETHVELEQYLAEQASTIGELYRILAPDGSICWQVGNYVEDGEIFPLDVYYYPIFKHLGMRLRNRVVWHFGHGLHATNRFSGRYETLLWFTKGNDYTFNLDDVRVEAKYPGKRAYRGPNKGKPTCNPKGKNPSDIWDVVHHDWETALWNVPNVKANHAEKTVHPAQFPIEVVERCVLAFTDEGDWVFDPYAGVGSALVAAIKQNRRAMGSEKEADYVVIARDRIEQFFQGVLRYRPLTRPVHEPTGREKIAQVPEEWVQQGLDTIFNNHQQDN